MFTIERMMLNTLWAAWCWVTAAEMVLDAQRELLFQDVRGEGHENQGDV